MVQGEGPQGRPGSLRPAGAQKAPGIGGVRGGESGGAFRGQYLKLLPPMNSRMREPCGMSSAPMGKKWR